MGVSINIGGDHVVLGSCVGPSVLLNAAHVEVEVEETDVVGISGGCASMRNAPDLRIQGTFPIFIVLRGILPLPHFIL